MGLFKVLGGAALGIGAIAAAPVFGAIGTVTAVGAVVGAAVGGIAGGISSSKDNEKVEEARRQGYREGKAENTVEIERIKDKINQAASRFSEYKEFEKVLLAMFSVSISLAYADGDFSDEEMEEIEGIIAGEAYMVMPESIKNTIERLYQEPPTFNEAMEYVKMIDKKHWSIIDEIIDYMIIADGVTRKEEVAFKDAWNYFKTA